MTDTPPAKPAVTKPVNALDPAQLAVEIGSSVYPEPFCAPVAGRARRRLGVAFGLTAFGVNLTRLAPGAQSALRHWHTRQDEFVYVVEGEVTLRTDAGDTLLTVGMCAGFPAGRPDGHCLINLSQQPAAYLEMGNRIEGDAAHYPDDDLWYHNGKFFHRDGQPW